MIKAKKRFMLTTALTVISTLFFNHLYASDFLVDTANNLVDTTAIRFSDLAADSSSAFDLASILPFHDHYLSWDTTYVHPYRFDTRSVTDTVQLVLADNADCGFVPMVAGTLTSGFGMRSRPKYRYTASKSRKRKGRGKSRRVFVGYGSHYHYGVDISLHTGDSVLSAFDGVVRISQYNYGGYGNCVVIRHYNGLETLYGHLSERNVVPGQAVRAGELIGLGGSTGHSTGPHLHFETRYKGLPLDPATLIDFTSKDSVGFKLKLDTLTLNRQSLAYYNRAVNYSRNTAAARRKPHYAYNPAPANGRLYVVRSGDNLYRIAQRHNTSINKLCQLNNISRETKLQLGQKLRLQ